MMNYTTAELFKSEISVHTIPSVSCRDARWAVDTVNGIVDYFKALPAGAQVTAKEVAMGCGWRDNYQRASAGLHYLMEMGWIDREEVQIGEREIEEEVYVNRRDIEKARALMEVLHIDTTALDGVSPSGCATIKKRVPIKQAKFALTARALEFLGE